jgi:hypothetical protein
MRTGCASSQSLASQADALRRLLLHPEGVPNLLGSEVRCGERATLPEFFARFGGSTEMAPLGTCFNRLKAALVDAPPGRSGSTGIRSALLAHFTSALVGSLACAPSGAEISGLRDVTSTLVGEVLTRALREHIETACGRIQVAPQSELIGWYVAKLWSPRGPTPFSAFVHLCSVAGHVGEASEVSALVRSLGDWKPWLGEDLRDRAGWAVMEALTVHMEQIASLRDGGVSDAPDLSFTEERAFLAAADVYLAAVESFQVDGEGTFLQDILSEGRRLEAKCMAAIYTKADVDVKTPDRLRIVRTWIARLDFYWQASDLVQRWKPDGAIQPPKLRWSTIGDEHRSGVPLPPEEGRAIAHLVDAAEDALSEVARLDPRNDPFPVQALERAAAAFLALREGESEAVIHSLLSGH